MVPFTIITFAKWWTNVQIDIPDLDSLSFIMDANHANVAESRSASIMISEQ